MPTHEYFLKAAVQLSAKNVQSNVGGPFGAVIVQNGRIIARGVNLVTAHNDPTAHAEVVAIRKACKKLKTFELSNCILYTSCEPCPMCLASAYWARVEAIYFANNRMDAAAIGFSDQDIYEEFLKELAERQIPIFEIPLNEAKEVFDRWNKNNLKVMY
jgi:tRNA(Arg) A34 adenosine deaminase TadA